jgi:hypothetical protein
VDVACSLHHPLSIPFLPPSYDLSALPLVLWGGTQERMGEVPKITAAGENRNFRLTRFFDFGKSLNFSSIDLSENRNFASSGKYHAPLDARTPRLAPPHPLRCSFSSSTIGGSRESLINGGDHLRCTIERKIFEFIV